MHGAILMIVKRGGGAFTPAFSLTRVDHPATRDIVALLPPSDLLVQLTPQRCEGVAHIAATYGDVDDAKARALSRRVLERCVAMWPHLPVYGPSNEALSRCRMFYQESARKLREWIDTNAPRIAADWNAVTTS